MLLSKKEFETLKRWSDEILGSQHTPEEKANLKLQIQDMSKALIGQRKVLAITKEVLKMAKAIRWP